MGRKDKWETYWGEYIKRIIVAGECSCLFTPCIKRYYNVVDVVRKHEFMIEMCNDFIRLKIREMHFREKSPSGLSKLGYDHINAYTDEKSHICQYSVNIYLRRIVEDILYKEFEINTNRIYDTYENRKYNFSNPCIYHPVIKKLDIYQEINIIDAIDLYDGYDYDLGRLIYEFFELRIMQVLRYKKYKKQHIQAEKYLKILNPSERNYGNTISENPDVFFNIIHLLFELKILENANSSKQ
jgi:hypothetical protein